MTGKVFFSVTMSLDGFIAPESIEDLMGQQWMELQQWVFPLRFFRKNLKLGDGGEEGRDNDIARETFEHEKRDPWERPGGTTFHFVNDGIETALDRARESATETSASRAAAQRCWST